MLEIGNKDAFFSPCQQAGKIASYVRYSGTFLCTLLYIKELMPLSADQTTMGFQNTVHSFL